MKISGRRFKRGLFVFAVVGCALGAAGAEPGKKATGIVMDKAGRPVEGATVEVCGVEHKLADGSWSRNHTPHCMLPRISIDKSGRFTLPFDEHFFNLPIDENGLRANLWFATDDFAPTYVSFSPRPQDQNVVMKRGSQVFGHVNRRIHGRLEPVKGAAVHLQCSAGDLALQKQIFANPLFFVMQNKEGSDLPYQHHGITDEFGEYVFLLSPPPEGKQWMVFCLGEAVFLDVKDGQPTQGPDFVVDVQIQATAKDGVQPAAATDGK